MMSAAVMPLGGSGVSGVAGRIAGIEARLGRPRSAGAATEPDPSVGFDPFGAVYQQALAGVPAGTGAGVAASSSGFTDVSVATLRTQSASRIAGPAGTRSASRTVGQVGGYGAMPVPAELAGYGNGNIPAAALESIGQGGHRLWAPAAENWRAAVGAASADGVELRVTDSYRSYTDQVQIAQDKGLYADGGLAAVPGTSNHGWGRAVDVDVDNAAALRWLQANGHRYGFVQAVTREPWHWEYRPDQA